MALKEGTRGNDTLTGTGDADTILAYGGSDRLDGLAGDDILDGGTGIDTMFGGQGWDTYYVDSTFDVVSEWGYIAFLDAMGDRGGSDVVIATCNFYVLPTASTGIAPVGTPGFGIIEVLVFEGGGDFTGYGNDVDNYIGGGLGLDLLSGFGGNDSLEGMGGFDELYGGDGNDTLDGGANTDSLGGGAGDDVYIVSSARDIVTELGLGPFGDGFDQGGIDEVRADCARYTLPKVSVLPSASGRTPRGQVENLTYVGERGPFTGIGNKAANVITGGDWNDRLDGGGGADVIVGGYGIDLMSGDAGADTFVIREYWELFDEFGPGSGGYDEITDFRPGADRIDLSGVDADATQAGNQAFTFVEGDGAFTASGQVRLVVAAGFSVLEICIDIAAGGAEAILLEGVSTLAATDLIL